MKAAEFIKWGKRRDFARRVGLSVSYLHQICQGERAPSTRLAVRISAETGGTVSVEELVNGPDADPWPAGARLYRDDPIPTRDDLIRLESCQNARILASAPQEDDE